MGQNLQELLEIDVLPLIASKGRGVTQRFLQLLLKLLRTNIHQNVLYIVLISNLRLELSSAALGEHSTALTNDALGYQVA